MTATASFAPLLYATPILVIWGLYLRRRFRRHRKSVEVRDSAIKSGLTEPASLHPIINPNRCIGCGSCVAACPEAGHEVLGLVAGRANLINPTHCIGHGACKTACPMDAITLVFGTAQRGVDIPVVKPSFETNVPNLFIAGELGGMGLIRNAITQGCKAMDSILKVDGVGKGGNQLDLVIIGAGPAGFAASLKALENKLNFVTVEQESLGGTVSHFPRGKLVMTAPVDLPMVGRVKFTETTKEELLEFWEDVEKKTQIKINYREKVDKINRIDGEFEVVTNKDTYRSRVVLLAIGRRGTPRKLGVPGEDQTKVVYRLIDPAQYRGQKVLVSGGGDSALEAATSIADEEGTEVTLSYRGDAFGRAKEKNRTRVAEAEAAGKLRVMLKSNVKAITETQIQVDQDNVVHMLDNDAVIICAGGILPTGFLKETGITVETKYGAP